MERRAVDLSKKEIIIIVLATILVGSTVFSSTKQSLTKAKELNTRDKIMLLQSAMNSRIEKKINLLTYLETCSTGGSWCPANQVFIKEILVDDSKYKTPLLPAELINSTGNFIHVKATSESTYLIKGQSVKGEQLCWIASSDEKETNLKKPEPSICPN